MKNNKGFTLVELLVAATIIGALAAFATVSYRRSAAEARWTAAKAKADQLAMAVQRLDADHPGIISSFSQSTLDDLTTSELNLPCPLKPGVVSTKVNHKVSPKALIWCGYLENGGWTNDYFLYQVKWRNNLSSARSCRGGVACVQIKNEAKMPSEYQYMVYYISSDGTSNTYVGDGSPGIVLW